MAQTSGGRTVGKGAGIVLGAIDSVRVGRQGRNVRHPVHGQCPCQQKFAIATASAVAADGDSRLAARQQYNGGSERGIVASGLAAQTGMESPGLARLALQVIGQYRSRP